MGIFKKLSEHDYQVTAFKAHKSYSHSGHKTGSGIYWLEGYDLGIETFAPNSSTEVYYSSVSDSSFTEPTNSLTSPDEQYHYKRTVWNSINQLYYKRATEPSKTSGPNRIKTFPYYGESLGEGGLRYNERFLGSNVVVISLPQETYGERIKPHTVEINDKDNNITLYDDGFGNLYDKDVNTGSAVSDNGLVGWWSFDEADTYKNNFVSSQVTCDRVIDHSLSGNSSNISGTPVFVSENISSSAGLKFGGSDYIEGTGSNFPYLPIDKRLNVRSVSFNFSGSNGGDIIHLSSTSSFDSNRHQWKIGLNSGKVTFHTVITSGSYSDKVYSSTLSTSNASYDTGVHNCVCQIKDGFKELYLDGSLVASESIILTEIRKKKDADGTLVEFPQYIKPTIEKLDNFRFGESYNGYLDEVRVYNRTLGSDEISTLHNHPSGLNFVGNIFYSQGLATITNREVKYRNAFRNPVSCSIKYKGDVTIYEHEITCTVNKGEFTHTLNRSARENWNSNSENVLPELTGSDFAPYITTVGIYDDDYNLIAIGKLSEPVSNDPKVEVTFVVRFDA